MGAIKNAIVSVIFLLPFIGLNLCAQGSWEKIDIPTTELLRTVCFVDSLYGWAAGNSGVIIHTEDGGENWVVQDSPNDHNIADIFFLDRDLGWATAFNYTISPYGTILLKTTNGGDDWVADPYPEENIFMNCILFLDSLRGWMGGSPHALVRTTDGGQSWNQASVDTATLAFFPVLRILFYDENYGYASGGMFDIAGVIWRTWDGGDHWYVIDVSDAPADEVRGLHAFDSLNVMGAGGDPDFGYGVGVIRTEDGGLNWDYEELGFQGNCYDLDFVNDTIAWAPLGPRRKFIYSTDGGIKWTEINTPDSTVILDVCFPDSLHGFAVGLDGAMLSYIPPLPVGVEEQLPQEPSSISINAYPNPFFSGTSLRISGTENLRPFITIKGSVYDIYGHEVALIEETINSTSGYTFRIERGDLPGGLYICKITLDDGVRIMNAATRLIILP